MTAFLRSRLTDVASRIFAAQLATGAHTEEECLRTAKSSIVWAKVLLAEIETEIENDMACDTKGRKR